MNLDGEGLTIVTEQLVEFGGVERIVDTLLERYPEASIVAVRFDPRPGFRYLPADQALERGVTARGSVRLVGPGGHRYHFLSPLYARRIGSVSLAGTATVLSLGGMGWSMAASAPPESRHIAYVGGPPRPLYSHWAGYAHDYRPSLRPLLRAATPALRAHYRALLKRPQRLITNSRASATGLRRVSRRPVDVLYPPVRTAFFTPAPRERKHFVAVSRLVSHKRLDLLVEAFRGLGERLVIAGQGPELEQMRATAPPNVSFAGHLEDEPLRELYRSSRALVSASVEEFGICLAEAQAAGIPVIAPRAGGACEIVRDGVSGVLLDHVDPAAVATAVGRIERLGIDPAACRRAAQHFSEERFLDGLDEALAI